MMTLPAMADLLTFTIRTFCYQCAAYRPMSPGVNMPNGPSCLRPARCAAARGSVEQIADLGGRLHRCLADLAQSARRVHRRRAPDVDHRDRRAPGVEHGRRRARGELLVLPVAERE